MKSITGYILYIDILRYKNFLRNYNSEDHDKVKSELERFTEIYITLDFHLAFGDTFNESKLLKRFFSDNFFCLCMNQKEIPMRI